jgi:hypothetical protein
MNETKAIATVREVARMVGLSPARFYQLQRAGVFPMPAYNAHTRRPYYTEEQQRLCLDVRTRSCGVNGQPVLFYTRRRKRGGQSSRQDRPRMPTPVDGETNSRTIILEAVRSLGLARVTATEVESATRDLFPAGTAERDTAEVIRAVFLRLTRQEKAV